MRYGRTYSRTREDIFRSETDAEFVRQYQESALRRVLTRAQRNSSYFSTQLRGSSDQRADLSTFELPKSQLASDID